MTSSKPFGVRSMVAPLRRVLVVRPTPVGDFEAAGWRAPARQAEPDFLAPEVERAGVPLIGRLTSPATADGGDMCWLDESTLAVGRGYRTNAAAHEQLAGLLAGPAPSSGPRCQNPDPSERHQGLTKAGNPRCVTLVGV